MALVDEISDLIDAATSDLDADTAMALGGCALGPVLARLLAKAFKNEETRREMAYMLADEAVHLANLKAHACTLSKPPL